MVIFYRCIKRCVDKKGGFSDRTVASDLPPCAVEQLIISLIREFVLYCIPPCKA